MKTRNMILIAFGTLVLVCIYGYLSSFGSANENIHTAPPANESLATPTPTATPTLAPTPVPEPAPFSVSGGRGQLLEKVHLEKGLTVFTINHPGCGWCEIWFSDKMRRIDPLISTSSGYYGRMAESITIADDYYIEVSSEDVWTVNVNQPRPTSAPGIPITLSGTGRQVSDFFTLEPGQTTFNIVHDGWSSFAVQLINCDGTEVELLPARNGPFDGSVTMNITQGGIYLLDMQADGKWKVSISV